LIQAGTARLEVTGGWVQGSRTVNNGQWHHVACTFQNDGSPDATDVKLYIDGTLETILGSQSAQAINTLDNGPVTIGTDVQGRFFTGVIDEVHIYDHALSAAEVASLFNDPNQSANVWHRRYFGDTPISWGVDDDSDGMSRLGEYAFGGQPLLPDPELAHIFPEIASDHLQVHFHRRSSGTHELLYQLQASPDLQSWAALPATEISSNPSGLEGFDDVVWRAQAAVSSGSKMFARLAVQRP